jgi:hypothetical protein
MRLAVNLIKLSPLESVGENFALEIELIMSVRKCFLDGSSSILNLVEHLLNYEDILRSHKLMYPLEESVIEAVEAGHMTKDLAILATGSWDV